MKATFSVFVSEYMDSWCGSFMSIDRDQVRLQLTSSPLYAKNISCQVTLRVNATQRMMFYFTDMDIEQSGSCAYDYLEMDDGISRTAAYIGGKEVFDRITQHCHPCILGFTEFNKQNKTRLDTKDRPKSYAPLFISFS